MPRHSRQTKQQALHLLRSGVSVRAVSAQLEVAAGTVATWLREAGGASGIEDSGIAPHPDDAPESRDLCELDRADYLRLAVAELDADVRGCREEGAWSPLKGLLEARSAHHRELVELERAEGSRLDLAADPTEVARRVEAMAELLRRLTVAMGET